MNQNQDKTNKSYPFSLPHGSPCSHNFLVNNENV
jgi:hypothetical protein